MVTHGNPYMSCPWDLKQEFGPLKDLEASENIMSFSSWGLLGTELIVTILKLSLHKGTSDIKLFGPSILLPN